MSEAGDYDWGEDDDWAPRRRQRLRGCTCLASYDGAKCEVCEAREEQAERDNASDAPRAARGT